MPDYLEFTSHENLCILIADDGSYTCNKLSLYLLHRGWKVVVLRFPKTLINYQLPLPVGVNSVQLADMSDSHLKQQLGNLSSNYGGFSAFIHLHPLIQSHDDNFSKAILKHVFLLAKYLKKSLKEAASQGRACFLTVTRLDGELGLRGKNKFGVIGGGLFGLTKTLNLEWEQVFCRAIDLHPELDAETAAQYIIAELHDPNRLITEVGYSLQRRATLIAKKSPVTSSVEVTKSKISSSSVFLVSGGGKGITAQCVIKLAQSAKCKFVLVGRSNLTPEPLWAKDCVDEAQLKQRILADLVAKGEKPTPVKVERVLKAILSQREIIETLQAVEKAGGKAEYISADITDIQALQEKLADSVKRFGAITGIIHGAGNLADKLIENKSEQDFEAVYAAKIAGLNTLINCVNPSQIQHLVLFSSAAGFYGNIGQSDYAIANEILNKFARYFQQCYPECHVVSFNWGPWDGGMVTPELKQIFAERNVEVIPISVGTQMLVDELTAENKTVQVLVGGRFIQASGELEPHLLTYRIRRQLTLSANPFLLDHAIGKHSVLPSTCAIAWMANICEQFYPGYKFFSCSDYQVFKGIVFDENLAREYAIDLQEINKSPLEEIELVVTIWSETNSGKPRYNYKAQIKLLWQIPPAPTKTDFDITQNPATVNLSPYQDGTLFHGSTFQGIKRILNLSKEKITMSCVLNKIDAAELGQFPIQTINHIALDVQYQSMLIWANHFYQAIGLPLRCQRGEHYEPINFGETFYVSMSVNSSNQTKLVSNIITHDLQGKIYSRVFGAEITLSKNLNRIISSEKGKV